MQYTRFEEVQNAIVDGDILLLSRRVTPQNVNMVDKERRMTLLMWAVSLRQHEAAKFLLDQGASLSPCDMFSFNAIHHAAWHADERMMKILLCSNLCHIQNDESEMAECHIGPICFRPGARPLVDLPHSYSGRTPLMFAALRGDIELVDFLLSKVGSDYLLKDFHGDTALDLAARYGHKSVVTYLLSKCSDVANVVYNKTRRDAELSCERASTLQELGNHRELNVILCREWFPQSLVKLH
ncbi:putative Ankyrin repeats (many copies) [Trypanosoma vivax]|nr:putative Ankyrin repeats (many copies) [Trypanosoma vivax]